MPKKISSWFRHESFRVVALNISRTFRCQSSQRFISIRILDVPTAPFLQIETDSFPVVRLIISFSLSMEHQPALKNIKETPARPGQLQGSGKNPHTDYGPASVSYILLSAEPCLTYCRDVQFFSLKRKQ